MLKEIVLPNNNEEEFAGIASKLGIKKLFFIYDFDKFEEKIREKVGKIEGYNGIKIEIGFLVSQKNIKKACKKSSLIVVKSSEQDRFFIEGKKISLIYGFEEIGKKDFMHQRASGINHIMCDILKKNNITVGFPYSSLFNKNEIASSILIGRMMQNIKLCEKYKVKAAIGAFSENPFDLRAPHDIRCLFLSLGMEPKNNRESFAIIL